MYFLYCTFYSVIFSHFRTYSVIAPRIIRPNRDFNVVVSLNNAEHPVTVTAQVGGSQNTGGTVINKQEIELNSESTQVIKFQVIIFDLFPSQRGASNSVSDS